MSVLARFMHTAREVLDEQARKVTRKDQPPFFVRTVWLFAELEELGIPGEAYCFIAIKIARLSENIAALAVPLAQIEANTETLTDYRKRHERRQLCKWIKDQIAREPQS